MNVHPSTKGSRPRVGVHMDCRADHQPRLIHAAAPMGTIARMLIRVLVQGQSTPRATGDGRQDSCPQDVSRFAIFTTFDTLIQRSLAKGQCTDRIAAFSL